MKIILPLLFIACLCSCGNSNADQIKLYTDSVGIVQRRLGEITDSISKAQSQSLNEVDPKAIGRLAAEKTILHIKRETYLKKIEELK